MKICFTFAKPTSQHKSVSQVPHTTPMNIHYRTCSAEVNTGSQILPHCAKRVVRLLPELKDMKSTMISLDVTSSHNPRSPSLIIFCSFQQRNKNVSRLTKPAPCSGLTEKNLAPRCPSQILLQIPFPTQAQPPLFYSVFPSLHALFSALQGCSSSQALAPEMRDAMWAARLASQPNCWCQVVLLCQGNTECGFAAVSCWHGRQATSTPEPQCVFSTNTRQWPNSWILWVFDFAHRSVNFQHQYPPSLHPLQKSCLTEVDLSTCFLSAVASSSSELCPWKVNCHLWEM